MKFVCWLIVYAMPSVALALGGGSTAGLEASKANASVPFVMLSMLVIIAIIGRLTK